MGASPPGSRTWTPSATPWRRPAVSGCSSIKPPGSWPRARTWTRRCWWPRAGDQLVVTRCQARGNNQAGPAGPLAGAPDRLVPAVPGARGGSGGVGPGREHIHPGGTDVLPDPGLDRGVRARPDERAHPRRPGGRPGPGRAGGQEPKLGPRQVALARAMYEEEDQDGRRRYTVAAIPAEFGVTRPSIYRHLGRARLRPASPGSHRQQDCAARVTPRTLSIMTSGSWTQHSGVGLSKWPEVLWRHRLPPRAQCSCGDGVLGIRCGATAASCVVGRSGRCAGHTDHRPPDGRGERVGAGRPWGQTGTAGVAP